MPKTKLIGLLHCGAPAPGMNRAAQVVVGQATEVGYTVLGLDGGLEALAKGESLEPRSLAPDDVRDWGSKGGSLLATSRFNPANVSGSAERIGRRLFGKGEGLLGLSALIVQGGDNTLSSCSQVSLANPKGLIVLIPATVDNDLPLPRGDETLGYHSFVDRTAGKVVTLLADARSCSRWYIAVTQGRHTGHVAADTAIRGSADLAFVPELWAEKVTMNQLVVAIFTSILKRFVGGQRSGVVVVPASVFNVVEGDAKLEELRVDNFGQRMFREVYVANRLARRLMKLCLAWGVEGLEIEGEGLSGFCERSTPPRSQDDALATTLASQAVGYLGHGKVSALITTGSALTFTQVVDPETGLAKSRPYDIAGKPWGDLFLRTSPFGQSDLRNGELLETMAAAAKNLSGDELKDQVADSLNFVRI